MPMVLPALMSEDFAREDLRWQDAVLRRTPEGDYRLTVRAVLPAAVAARFHTLHEVVSDWLDQDVIDEEDEIDGALLAELQAEHDGAVVRMPRTRTE
ncbi:hypothetical protein [Yinghuangia soli]|uniref:Uncharacterized protein n=1 Tax=Yinghuangia soli TaxID=2908204 RepID=A0AA41U0Y9_9ACTN|nr:hypothetical protein [Yinghuangia soli]MCF2526937.1 hypothetical protein [Yinghuangia soli]